MSNNLPSIWSDSNSLSEIKKIYGKDLSDGEFTTLCQIGQATGLNPFLREIWAVKYGNTPASIFIGRDGYRKSAQSNPDYDYHICDTVYENDQFSVEKGEIQHSYQMKDRGKIYGAYCLVKRKGSSKSSYTFCLFSEYSTGKSLWQTKPATMIKKVAEAQGLRMTFQSLFSGTYSEEESWMENRSQSVDIQVEPSEKQFLAKQIFDEYYDIKNEKNPTEYSAHLKQGKLSKILKSLYNKQSINELTEAECSDFVINIQDKMSELFTKVEVEV